MTRAPVEKLEHRHFLSAGELDLGFGTNGISVTEFPGGGSPRETVDFADSLLLPDGKTLYLGTMFPQSVPATQRKFIVARYLTNGALDPVFGVAGRAIIPVADTERAFSFALQSTGKIVIGGAGASSEVVTRLTQEGSLDMTFGTSGFYRTDVVGFLSSIAIQSDDKIVFGTQAFNTGVTGPLVRLLPEGGRDSTFGPNGNGEFLYINAGAIQNDVVRILPDATGRLVVASMTADLRIWKVAGVTSTGSLAGPVTVLDFSSGTSNPNNGLRAFEPAPGGKYIADGVAGERRTVRLSADLALDDTWDGDGVLSIPVGSSPQQARGVAVASDGRITLVGIGQTARRLENGTADLAYGNNGFQNLDLEVPGFVNEFTTEALRRPDGRLVLAGTATVPGTPQRPQPLLAQLQADTEVRISTLDYEFDAATAAVAVSLNLDGAGSVSLDDLILENLTTGQMIGAASNVVYDAGHFVARFDYADLPNKSLPDGNYRAMLAPGGLTGPNGEPTLADQTFEFFVLAGDANRDRRVNIADFSRLGANFSTAGSFDDGDFNYSGQVEIGDFSILAASFNKHLPPPTARIGLVSARPFTSHRLIASPRLGFFEDESVKQWTQLPDD